MEQSSPYWPSPSAIQSHKTSAKSLPQAWHVKHLKAIAHKIPPINETAKIHLLPLGWTISGQMCLDFASGPAHVLTHLTSLSTVMEKEPETGRRIYELVPCPNQIKVTAPSWSVPLTTYLGRHEVTSPVSPVRTVSFWRNWIGVYTRTQGETGRCPYHSVTSARLCRTIEFKQCSVYKGFSRHLPGNPK